MPIENIDATPDAPVPFGYKMAWLALKTSDSEAVLAALPIVNVEPANWSSGIEAAYDGNVFVSPPVNGWTLVVSLQFPQNEDLGGELSMLLSSLSERFNDLQYFGTHRIVEFHAWAMFSNGQEKRAYAYLGEQGAIMANRGTQTSGESELGYEYFDEDHPDSDSDEYWDREDLVYPDEEHVMEVAGKWSINPQTLDALELASSLGWVAQYEKVSR